MNHIKRYTRWLYHSIYIVYLYHIYIYHRSFKAAPLCGSSPRVRPHRCALRRRPDCLQRLALCAEAAAETLVACSALMGLHKCSNLHIYTIFISYLYLHLYLYLYLYIISYHIILFNSFHLCSPAEWRCSAPCRSSGSPEASHAGPGAGL